MTSMLKYAVFGSSSGLPAEQPVNSSPARGEPAGVVPAAEEPDDVCERIPSDRKRADLNRDGVDRGKGQGEERRAHGEDLDFLRRGVNPVVRPLAKRHIALPERRNARRWLKARTAFSTISPG